MENYNNQNIVHILYDIVHALPKLFQEYKEGVYVKFPKIENCINYSLSELKKCFDVSPEETDSVFLNVFYETYFYITSRINFFLEQEPFVSDKIIFLEFDPFLHSLMNIVTVMERWLNAPDGGGLSLVKVIPCAGSYFATTHIGNFFCNDVFEIAIIPRKAIYFCAFKGSFKMDVNGESENNYTVFSETVEIEQVESFVLYPPTPNNVKFTLLKM